MSDGRCGQGRIHPVAVVLTLCAAAVVAGMSSFSAIAGWVADVPRGAVGPALPPARRTAVEGDDLAGGHRRRRRRGGRGDQCVVVAARQFACRPFGENPAGEDPAGQGGTGDGPAHHRHDHHDHGDHHDHDAAAGSSKLLAIAVDGKTVRGATDAEGNQAHLLAAATHHDALVLGQVEVGAKTNEIPMFAPLLDQLAASRGRPGPHRDHRRRTPPQRSHAQYLHERGAGFVFTVKHNQPGLFAALDALPWTDTPVAHRQIDRGHGRITTRTIQILPAPPDLPFPHVDQVWLIERYVTDPPARQPPRSPRSASPTCAPTRAGPAHMAGLVKDHWGIESLHWLRDTVYREDHSRVRTRSGPRVMAGLRNLGIGALHLAGRRDITEATRWAGRFMHRPFRILGLTP